MHKPVPKKTVWPGNYILRYQMLYSFLEVVFSTEWGPCPMEQWRTEVSYNMIGGGGGKKQCFKRKRHKEKHAWQRSPLRYLLGCAHGCWGGCSGGVSVYMHVGLYPRLFHALLDWGKYTARCHGILWPIGPLSAKIQNQMPHWPVERKSWIGYPSWLDASAMNTILV